MPIVDGYKFFHDCFVRINAYSLEFQLSRRFPISRSSPAEIGYRRAFNSLKHKKIYPLFH